MTTGSSARSTDLLEELTPAVERYLERHIQTSTEWFPHEYVPYGEGRDYREEPWQASDSRLAGTAQTCLELNLLTEDNLPSYVLALWDIFGGDGAWGEWSRRWTAEEGRHSIVLRDYLSVTRGLDPVALERARMDQVCSGYRRRLADEGPLDGVVFTTLQELATRISHRNTGKLTAEPSLERLTSRIAQDENLHYVFYRDVGAAALEIDPSPLVIAMERQVRTFAMPSASVPGFGERAKGMADAGVYDLRLHHDQVLRPVLFQHWRLHQLSGLTAEAEVARDRLIAFVAKVDRAASRFEESRARRLGLEPALEGLAVIPAV
jgi:acyl-[acyl-carrier-protein] desaturase